MFINLGTAAIDCAYRELAAPSFAGDLERHRKANERYMEILSWLMFCRAVGLSSLDRLPPPAGQIAALAVTEPMFAEALNAISQIEAQLSGPKGLPEPNFETEDNLMVARYALLTWLTWWLQHFKASGQVPVMRFIGVVDRGDRPIPPYPQGMQPGEPTPTEYDEFNRRE